MVWLTISLVNFMESEFHWTWGNKFVSTRLHPFKSPIISKPEPVYGVDCLVGYSFLTMVQTVLGESTFSFSKGGSSLNSD